MDPKRWRLFLWDVAGSASSIYMMKFGAHIPLSGKPFPHDPRKFPKLKKWQQAAALEIVYQYKGREGPGTFPGEHLKLPHNKPTTLLLPLFRSPKVETGHL